MMEWPGVVNVTAHKYFKGEQDKTIRDRKLLALAESRGRIKFGSSGYDFNWIVKAVQKNLTGYGDGTQIQYDRLDRRRMLTLENRGYYVQDYCSVKEKLMNRGPEAIINRYKQIFPDLSQDFRDQFCEEFYVDGEAIGNENRIHGIESFMGTGTTVAADKVAQPSDTYAGKSTALGNLGGSWSTTQATSPNAAVATDWPQGKGDSEYDYMSPKIINYTSTSWGTGSTTWGDNSERAMRYGATYSRLTGGKEGMLDMYLLSGNLFVDYQNKVAAQQRIIVESNSTPLRKLGFLDTMNQDGVEITTEFGIPDNVGYGFNIDKLTLLCMEDMLIKPTGPDYTPDRPGWAFLVHFFGNLRFDDLKGFVKLAAIA